MATAYHYSEQPYEDDNGYLDQGEGAYHAEGLGQGLGDTDHYASHYDPSMYNDQYGQEGYYDEQGNPVDEHGNSVDEQGNPLDEQGYYPDDHQQGYYQDDQQQGYYQDDQQQGYYQDDQQQGSYPDDQQQAYYPDDQQQAYYPDDQQQGNGGQGNQQDPYQGSSDHSNADEQGASDANTGNENAPGGHPDNVQVPPGPSGSHPAAHPQVGAASEAHPEQHEASVPPPHPAAAPPKGGVANSGAQAAPGAPPAGGTGGFSIALKNNTQGSKVLAYITGQALDHGNTLFILGSDGKTPIYPQNPSSVNTPLSEDCGIDLGPSGNTRTVSIPHIAGGRIWFAIDGEMKFEINPGPALVEPSPTNQSDANYHTNWGFCELTYSPQQLYANISYVDFVSIPIALELTTGSGGTQKVTGLEPDGLNKVCQGLEEQGAKDHQGWETLVVKNGDTILRALSPNQGMVINPSLFATYFDETVTQVWDRFSKEQMTVDTQAAAGKVTGQVSGDVLVIGGVSLNKPTTHDIMTCSTGPFATGSNAEANAIIPRIGAAFNRSTLLTNTDFPAAPKDYYQEEVTNHYSRIVHAANQDGKGYAFPYDDVQQTGGPDQSGEVHASDPKVLTVTVGGGGGSGVQGQPE